MAHRPTVYIYEFIENFLEISTVPFGDIEYGDNFTRVNLYDLHKKSKDVTNFLTDLGFEVKLNHDISPADNAPFDFSAD